MAIVQIVNGIVVAKHNVCGSVEYSVYPQGKTKACPEAYYTDDKQDALDTSTHMARQSNSQQ